MLHNASVIKLGSHGSTDLVATEEVGLVEAGLVCHRKSDGTVTVLSSDGMAVGVSLGETLDGDTSKQCVARAGNEIPLQVTPEGIAIGDLTFVPLVENYSIEFVDGGTAGAEVVSVDEDTKVISVSMDDGVSTATQLKAAMDAETDIDAIIASTTIAAGQDAVAQAAFAATEIPVASYVVPGGVVKYSATTGKVTSDGTATGAIYLTNVKTGVKYDKSECFAAMIDMGGGL